jgi:hypothetical protein
MKNIQKKKITVRISELYPVFVKKYPGLGFATVIFEVPFAALIS